MLLSAIGRIGHGKNKRKNLAKLILSEGQTYHPLGKYGKAAMARPDAAFYERWNLMAPLLLQSGAKNFCDLGCAEGFYVRQASQEFGIFSVGIDNDRKRLDRAIALNLLYENHQAAFIQMEISSHSLYALPPFDVVACMSLLHHVIFHQGLEQAEDLLRVLSSKVRKMLFFDMGGPDEQGNEWADSLLMLRGNVDVKITQLLLRSGFTSVRPLGKTLGYATNATRTLFTAEPTR